jgi:hypothetical protein
LMSAALLCMPVCALMKQPLGAAEGDRVGEGVCVEVRVTVGVPVGVVPTESDVVGVADAESSGHVKARIYALSENSVCPAAFGEEIDVGRTSPAEKPMALAYVLTPRPASVLVWALGGSRTRRR